MDTSACTDVFATHAVATETAIAHSACDSRCTHRHTLALRGLIRLGYFALSVRYNGDLDDRKHRVSVVRELNFAYFREAHLRGDGCMRNGGYSNSLSIQSETGAAKEVSAYT